MNPRPLVTPRPLVSALRRLAVGLAWTLTTLVLLVVTGHDAKAQCTVCDSCTTAADCGPTESCFDFGDGVGRCSRECSDGICPGDSLCFQLQDQNGQPTGNACLNADAATAGLCPATWQCANTCASAGASCANDGAACGPDTDLCVRDSEDNLYCACYCLSDADCGPGNSCIALQDGGGACFPDGGGNTGLCADVMCPSGQVCDPGTGNCVSNPDDLCADVMCPSGAICSPATGTCIGGSTDTSTATDTASATDTADSSDTATDTTTGTDTGGASDTSILLPGTDTRQTTLEDTDENCSCAVNRAPSGPTGGGLALCLIGLALVARRRRPTC